MPAFQDCGAKFQMRTHFRLLRLRRPALLYGYNVQLDAYRHSSQGEAGSAIAEHNFL